MRTAAVIRTLGVTLLLAAAVSARQPGQWQGGLATVDARQPDAATSSFFIHNTGGDGGMGFSRGDLRGNQLDAAFWSDGRHGVACGGSGSFYTEDGGLSWRRIRRQPRNEYPDAKGSVIYYQVEMAGPRDIWLAEGRHPAVGRSLWHSTDAGATWEDVVPRFPGEFKSVWDLLVRGPHIWLLGGWEPQASYRSDDGGKTWELLELPEGIEPFRAVTPADAPLDSLGTVYLLGARRLEGQRTPALFRSDDAGASWRELPLPEAVPWQFSRATIAFGTADAGMIGLHAPGYRRTGHGKFEKNAGASAAVLVTTDGGQSWQRRALPDEEFFVTALWCAPDQPGHAFAGVFNGFLAQRSGPRLGPALYETLDGGRTWSVAIHGKVDINVIVGLNSRHVWAIGDRPGTGAMDVVAILQPSPAGADARVTSQAERERK